MKVSTKARYGLRALVDLAVHTTGKPIPLEEIGKRQGVSSNYITQVFVSLKKANIVQSTKGPKGGYRLNGQSSDVTVGDIIRAIEGEILVVEEDSMEAQGSVFATNIQQILYEKVWDKMTQSICEVIDQITLEDLVKAQQVVQKEESMYYI